MTTLSNLPNELIIRIALTAGFSASLTLSQTCRRFRSLLTNPHNWTYYEDVTDDDIEIEVRIETRLHTFDHLIFGVWQNYSNAERVHEMGNKLRQGLTLFVEHRASEKSVGFEYLGGMTVNLSPRSMYLSNTKENQPNQQPPDKVIQTKFYEPREVLQCFITHFNEELQRLRASVPQIHSLNQDEQDTFQSELLKSFQHSCDACVEYNNRRELECMLLSQVKPVRNSEGDYGYEYVYPLSTDNSKDSDARSHSNKRSQYRVKVRIEAAKRWLPGVGPAVVKLNNKPLSPSLQRLWESLVFGNTAAS